MPLAQALRAQRRRARKPPASGLPVLSSLVRRQLRRALPRLSLRLQSPMELLQAAALLVPQAALVWRGVTAAGW